MNLIPTYSSKLTEEGNQSKENTHYISLACSLFSCKHIFWLPLEAVCDMY